LEIMNSRVGGFSFGGFAERVRGEDEQKKNKNIDAAAKKKKLSQKKKMQKSP